jgi:hypothetical protein
MARRTIKKAGPETPALYETSDGFYVFRTNLGTWVVASEPVLTLDNMIEIDGQYHHATLDPVRKGLRTDDPALIGGK